MIFNLSTCLVCAFRFQFPTLIRIGFFLFVFLSFVFSPFVWQLYTPNICSSLQQVLFKVFYCLFMLVFVLCWLNIFTLCFCFMIYVHFNAFNYTTASIMYNALFHICVCLVSFFFSLLINIYPRSLSLYMFRCIEVKCFCFSVNVQAVETLYVFCFGLLSEMKTIFWFIVFNAEIIHHDCYDRKLKGNFSR